MQIIRLVLTIALLAVSSALFAQTITSDKLFYAAEEINSLTKIIDSHAKSSQSLSKSSWQIMSADVRYIALMYRLASIELAIVESKSTVNLKKYRFGNKNVGKDNQEEANTNFLTAWMLTQGQIKFFREMENEFGVQELIYIRNQLQKTNQDFDNYALALIKKYQKD